MSVMEIFLSVRSAREASVAAQFPCIVDVKSPARGSLGAAPLATIRAIARHAVLHGRPLSVALGDSPPWKTGDGRSVRELLSDVPVRYVKLGTAGLIGHLTFREMEYVIRRSVDEIKDISPRTRVFLGCFADFYRCGAPHPHVGLAMAWKCGADGLLVDTYKKNREESLFSHFNWEELATMRQECADALLQFAVAGNLQPSHVFMLKNICPHYVGFRSAVTTNGARKSGIDPVKIRRLFHAFEAARQLACG